MATATHVYVKRGKPTPLGAQYDGPFRIEERLGDSCLRVLVAHYANGTPRHEIVHWKNCKVGHFLDQPPVAHKPALGRKPKNDVSTAAVHIPAGMQSGDL